MNEDIQQVLLDFIATTDAKPNLSNQELLSKFPEFKNDSKLLQSAWDYKATKSSGKYSNDAEINSKFPEFFSGQTTTTEPVKKKETSLPDGSPVQETETEPQFQVGVTQTETTQSPTPQVSYLDAFTDLEKGFGLPLGTVTHGDENQAKKTFEFLGGQSASGRKRSDIVQDYISIQLGKPIVHTDENGQKYVVEGDVNKVQQEIDQDPELKNWIYSLKTAQEAQKKGQSLLEYNRTYGKNQLSYNLDERGREELGTIDKLNAVDNTLQTINQNIDFLSSNPTIFKSKEEQQAQIDKEKKDYENTMRQKESLTKQVDSYKDEWRSKINSEITSLSTTLKNGVKQVYNQGNYYIERIPDEEKQAIEQKIKDLELQKAGLFGDFKTVYDAEKSNIDSYSLIPSNIPPKDRLMLYAQNLNREKQELWDKKISKMEGLDIAKEGLTQFFKGTDPDLKRYMELEQKLKVISPLVLLNRPVEKETGGSFVSNVANIAMKGMTDNPIYKTEQDDYRAISEALGVSGTRGEISPISEERLKEGETIKPGGQKFWENTIGGTASIVLPMMVTGGLYKGLTQGTKLAEALSSLKAGKPVMDVLSSPSRFGTALQWAQSKAPRWMKILTSATESGVTYEAAGELFKPSEDELSFLSGVFGGIGKEAAGLLFGKLFAGAPDQAKKLLSYLGGGVGETAEEFMQTIVQAWQQTPKGQSVIDELKKQFPDADSAVWGIVASFMMGSTMSASEGSEFFEFSKEEFNKLDPAKKKQAEAIVSAMKNDIDNTAVALSDGIISESRNGENEKTTEGHILPTTSSEETPVVTETTTTETPVEVTPQGETKTLESETINTGDTVELNPEDTGTTEVIPRVQSEETVTAETPVVEETKTTVAPNIETPAVDVTIDDIDQFVADGKMDEDEADLAKDWIEGATKSNIAGTAFEKAQLLKAEGVNPVEEENVDTKPIIATEPKVDIKIGNDLGGGVIDNTTDSDVKYISTKDLNELRNQPKTNTSSTPSIVMEGDIEKNGIQKPLELVFYPNEGVALLSDGHNRLDISSELGAKEMPVKIIESFKDAPNNAKPFSLTQLKERTPSTEKQLTSSVKENVPVKRKKNVGNPSPVKNEKNSFPLLGGVGFIPEHIARKAYEYYYNNVSKAQSFETIARRGGFSEGEMDYMYPDWREELSATEVKTETPNTEQKNKTEKIEPKIETPRPTIEGKAEQGDTVLYEGKEYRIDNVNSKGKMTLIRVDESGMSKVVDVEQKEVSLVEKKETRLEKAKKAHKEAVKKSIEKGYMGGLDMEVIKTAIELGLAHIENGATKFSDWFREMRATVSEKFSDKDIEDMWNEKLPRSKDPQRRTMREIAEESAKETESTKEETPKEEKKDTSKKGERGEKKRSYRQKRKDKRKTDGQKETTRNLAHAEKIIYNPAIDQSVKDEMLKHGIEYLVKAHSVSLAEAQALFDAMTTDEQNGVEAVAEYIIAKNIEAGYNEGIVSKAKRSIGIEGNISGDVLTVLSHIINLKLSELRKQAIGNPEEEQRISDIGVRFALSSAQRLKALGQAISAAQVLQTLTPEMMVASVRAEKLQSQKAAIEKMGGDKVVEGYFDEMMDEVEKAVEEAIAPLQKQIDELTSEIVQLKAQEESGKPKKKQSTLRKAISKLDALEQKWKSIGNLNDVSSVVALAIIKAVKQALKVGASIQEAIEKGIEAGKKANNGNTIDEEKYRSDLRNELGNEETEKHIEREKKRDEKLNKLAQAISKEETKAKPEKKESALTPEQQVQKAHINGKYGVNLNDEQFLKLSGKEVDGMSVSQIVQDRINEQQRQKDFEKQQKAQAKESERQAKSEQREAERQVKAELNERKKEEAKKITEAIQEIVRGHYLDGNPSQQTLTTKLIEAGIDPDRAEVLSAQIQDRVNKAIDARRASIIKASRTKRAETAVSKQKRGAQQKLLDMIKMGGLDDEAFKAKLAESMGVEEITPEMEQQIMTLQDAVFSYQMAIQGVSEKLSKSQVDELYKKEKAAKEAWIKLSSILHPPGNMDRFITMMTGNLLTLASLIQNVISMFVDMPLRFAGSLASASISKTLNAITKGKLGSPNAFMIMLARNQGFWNSKGMGQPRGMNWARMWHQAKIGISPQAVVGGEHVRGLHPKDVWKRMWQGFNMTTVTNLLEGTFGWPAEFMLRGLSAGDQLLANSSGMAKAFEIAARKGIYNPYWRRLSEEEQQANMEKLRAFLANPDKESQDEINAHMDYVAFRKGLFGDVAGGAVENITSNMEKAVRGVMPIPFLGTSIGDTIASLVRLMIKASFPFVRTPMNIVQRAVMLANPEAMAAISAAYQVHAHNLAKANRAESEKAQINADHYRELMYQGFIILGVATSLAAVGLIRGDDDDNDEKNVALNQYRLHKNSLNISGLIRWMNGGDPSIRREDIQMDLTRIGLGGLLLAHHATVKRQNRFEAETNVFSRLINDRISGLPTLAQNSLDMSVFKGMNTMLNAIATKEYDRWFENLISAPLSVVAPNQLGSIMRTARDFQVDAKDYKGLFPTIAKIMIQKWMPEPNYPHRIDVWGNPVTQTPSGANPIEYNLLGIGKFRDATGEDFAFKLASEADKFPPDEAKNYFPSRPDAAFRYNGKSYTVTGKEREAYEKYVGENRANLVRNYIYSQEWDNSLPEKRESKLKKLYSEGQEDGKLKWLHEYRPDDFNKTSQSDVYNNNSQPTVIE